MDDLIKRADAIDAVMKHKMPFSIQQEVAREIGALPSADAEQEAVPTVVRVTMSDGSQYYLEHERDAIQAEAVDCTDFVNWLTDAVMDEEDWELNAVAYGEIICRKLEKLGVLEVTEEPSYYIRPSADAVPIVYCMDCAKSVPLDEHGALWKCKAHDRTTLRHSYCNNGERKGGDPE